MTYDPEAVVAEFCGKDWKVTNHSHLASFGYNSVTVDRDGNSFGDLLRAALLAAHRAGREEAWGKAREEALRGSNGFEGCGCDDMIVNAARADGIDL